MVNSFMKKLSSVIIAVVICLGIVLGFGSSEVFADSVDTDNGYKYDVVIMDEAFLLSYDEQEKLRQDMLPISKYANVAFVSVLSNSSSTQSYAEMINESLFNSNGIVFVIDMDNRYLYIDSTGDAKKYITKSNADSITDNIYRDATKKNYYRCASRCYDQILNICEGKSIPMPMKFIGNAVLALVIGFFIFFLVVKSQTRMKATTNEVVMSILQPDFRFENPNVRFIKQTRVYHSSGGGGGHGGGGHGGGGHSGGGHGF